MKFLQERLRPPRKKHGGKFYLARSIVSMMRRKPIFVEPFGGGASVMLNREPTEIEIFNDLDWFDANLFACLRDHGFEIIADLTQVPYDEATFIKWRNWLRPIAKLMEDGIKPDGWNVKAALATIIVARFSRGGMGVDFAWSERERGGRPGDLNSWLTWRENDLPRTVERVRNWQTTSRDGVEVASIYADRKDASFYFDPPYLPDVRSHSSTYGAYEMDRDAHIRLLRLCQEIEGDVAISGYDSGLYREHLEGWRAVEIELPNNSGQGEIKNRRTEIVWLNFEPESIPKGATIS